MQRQPSKQELSRQEFPISIVLGGVSFFAWFTSAFRDSTAPFYRAENPFAKTMAIALVLALISFFCALNTLRAKTSQKNSGL